MGKSPSIILTSQYTIPNQKSFTTYVDYCMRQKALLKDGHTLTNTELTELSRLQNAIDSFDMERGSPNSNQKKVSVSEKEAEAKVLLTSPNSFNTTNDFEKYVSYMGRKYALESKKKMTKTEEEEMSLLNKHIEDLSPEEMKEGVEAEGILSGVFSKNKNVITSNDLNEIKELVGKAQNKGSVYYQDVISFDTDFLIEQKLYDPVTDILDENRIRNASHKMMEQLFKDEQIEENNGFWFASIHRNTEHIHIHFGTVEKENRRKLVEVKVDGETFYEPKGKRKQSTLDHMKTTFANSLVDRTSELSRISNLRNNLVQEVKKEYLQSKEKQPNREVTLLQEIYNGLPSNKKDWTYGSKRMPNKTRNKIDELTGLLMKDNPIFNEYKEAVDKESSFQKGLYGESEREDKDYAKNQMKDMQKRMGNSLLKELKKKNPYEDNPLYQFQQKNEQIKKKYERGRSEKRREYPTYSRYKPPLIRKKDVRNIEAALNDDLTKWRAEQEYERVQERIARQQEMEY
ncbi:relaxase MobL (plasmid) [Bacillus thuringiensis]|uniref:MobP2 family relaxase n=1 Tax=Bacillus thuringiensis TaxID=1428 RepID=UPI00222478A0|nr:MobP2 family relaxase [Bacillus thuringiensis]UYX55937.1 relaxase MobL [Bacillus thuringiensis]